MAEASWPTVDASVGSIHAPEIMLEVHETRIRWGYGTSDASQISLVCEPVSAEHQTALAVSVVPVWLKLHGLPNRTCRWQTWAWHGFCASVETDDEGRTVVVFSQERPSVERDADTAGTGSAR